MNTNQEKEHIKCIDPWDAPSEFIFLTIPFRRSPLNGVVTRFHDDFISAIKEEFGMHPNKICDPYRNILINHIKYSNYEHDHIDKAIRFNELAFEFSKTSRLYIVDSK